MTDDPDGLRQAVAYALLLADRQERHPAAAMLADILDMLEQETVAQGDAAATEGAIA